MQGLGPCHLERVSCFEEGKACLASPGALLLHKAPQRVDAGLLGGAELLARLVHLLQEPT